MSKIKLIVEIEKRTYELIKDKPDNIAESIIANGTPYNSTGEAISREALKNNEPHYDEEGYRVFYESEIDNAQAAEVRTAHDVSDAYDRGFITAKRVYSRPKGEWIELPKAFDSRELPCKCSICGHILSFMNYYPKSNFCPNCGADMRKGGAEE